jgi:hypothetical protein
MPSRDQTSEEPNGSNGLVRPRNGALRKFPVWWRNGPELFFLGPDQRIMVAVYTGKGDSFAAGKPVVRRTFVQPQVGSRVTSRNM